MKRLRRLLFNLAAVVSLVLCIVVARLWLGRTTLIGWAARQSDGVSYHSYAVRSGNGMLELIRLKYISGDPYYFDARSSAGQLYPTGFFWRQDASFDVLTATTFIPAQARVALYTPRQGGVWANARIPLTPHWLAIILLLLLPTRVCFMATRACILAIRDRRLNHQINSGRCPTCGYDLRATPDRCPECGTIPKPAEARQT